MNKLLAPLAIAAVLLSAPLVHAQNISTTSPSIGKNTFTGPQTINDGTANEYGLILTPPTLASGTTGHGLNFVDTVNDASAVDGILWFSNTTCTVCTATSYLFDFQVGGTPELRLSTGGTLIVANALTISAGNLSLPASNTINWSGRGVLTSKAAGSIQLGSGDGPSPVAQTLSAQGARGGTDSNVGGGALTIASGDGTGTGTPSTMTLQTPHAAASGSTQQTMNAQITLGDNTVTINQITTGTNADFVCASAGLVLLIQSSSCTISRRSLKEDIAPFAPSAGLADVLALKPESFRMKPDGNRDPNYTHPQHGFIADEVSAVDPKLAVYDDDMHTPKSYRAEGIISALVGAVQAQQAEIAALKTELHHYEHGR